MEDSGKGFSTMKKGSMTMRRDGSEKGIKGWKATTGNRDVRQLEMDRSAAYTYMHLA